MEVFHLTKPHPLISLIRMPSKKKELAGETGVMFGWERKPAYHVAQDWTPLAQRRHTAESRLHDPSPIHAQILDASLGVC